jgi:hypothetical protein
MFFDPKTGFQCHKAFAMSASAPMIAAAPNPYATERAI